MNARYRTRLLSIKKQLAERGVALRPCLREAEVRQFENAHKVRLPSGYRQFLLHVANGHGPVCPQGPASELYSLGVSHWYWQDPVRNRRELRQNLSRRFPFTEAWVHADPEEEGYDEKYVATFFGNLYLAGYGDAYWILVVKGPERGKIWMRSEYGVQTTEPKRDFVTWYEEWLVGNRNWW